MRLVCYLREIRGDRSIREISEASGVHRGTLSKLENGKLVPLEKEIAPLERAYGKPIEQWYSARSLLALQEEEAA